MCFCLLGTCLDVSGDGAALEAALRFKRVQEEQGQDKGPLMSNCVDDVSQNQGLSLEHVELMPATPHPRLLSHMGRCPQTFQE